VVEGPSWLSTHRHLTAYRIPIRFDGTPFRNFLTVLPVRDVHGLYCYSIAAMADVSTLDEATKTNLTRLQVYMYIYVYKFINKYI